MNQFARPGLAVTELPPVNADDNGKVLGVSDGAWAKVAASGGSDLPDDPAQDGTYNLQNTVSSGTGTLSWASGGSSGGGVLVVHDVDGTLDKTWQEIYDAVKNGTVVIFLQNMSDGEIQQYYLESIASDGGYCVYLQNLGSGAAVGYFANSASDYPSAN